MNYRMFVLPEKFKSKPSRKRLTEAKHRKSFSTKITNQKLIIRNLSYDIGLGTLYKNGESNNGFQGYKFVVPDPINNGQDIDSPKLKWNDGVFWYYGSNFFETPPRAELSGGIAGNSAPPLSPTNVLVNNRRLFGGTKIVYGQDPNAVTWDISDETDSAVGWLSPYVALTGTNKVHPFSQNINLREQMVYYDKALQYQTNRMQKVGNLTMFPGPSIGPIALNNNDDHPYGQNMQELVQNKLKKHLKFAVRNIVLLYPNSVNDKNYDISGYENPLPVIEKEILNDIFQRTDDEYGPAEGTNRDLYRRTNPKYRVMRDWKQTYTFGNEASPQIVKTKFYHRYNENYPIECDLTKVADVASMDRLKNYDELIPEDDLVNPGIDGIQDETTSLDNGATVTTEPTTEMPLQNSHPSVAEPSAKKVRLNDGTVAAALQQTEPEVYMDTDTTGYEPDRDLTFNPRTHRIVWLRFPRFASTFELQNINDGDFLPSAFISSEHYRTIVDRCGVRIRGSNQFKFVRPQNSGTGGRLVDIKANNSSGETIRIGPEFS
jgi:hypothetical protein